MGREIILERFYPYPPAAVWNAIATSEALADWLMPNNFKLEYNHKFTFNTKPQPGFDGVVNCELVDFEIEKKLVFTWQGGPLKKPTLVSFELKAQDNGTILQFKQSGFDGFINRYIVRSILLNGWKDLLNNKMSKYLAK